MRPPENLSWTRTHAHTHKHTDVPHLPTMMLETAPSYQWSQGALPPCQATGGLPTAAQAALVMPMLREPVTGSSILEEASPLAQRLLLTQLYHLCCQSHPDHGSLASAVLLAHRHRVLYSAPLQDQREWAHLVFQSLLFEIPLENCSDKHGVLRSAFFCRFCPTVLKWTWLFRGGIFSHSCK